MTRGRQVEVVEIPIEQLSYVPGPHTGRLAVLRQWSERHDGDGTADDGALPTAPAQTTTTPGSAVGLAGFRRLIDLPGGHLAPALGAWWRDDDHDDGHLRLDVPHAIGEAWSLAGAFRRRRTTRWVPVELILSPYFGRWTLLELMPRRAVHTNPVYFRAGHRSLDRFVEVLRTNDPLPHAP